MGIEPTTYSLGSCRSTTELRPRRQEDNEIRAAAASATIAARMKRSQIRLQTGLLDHTLT
jgi:hypothetical protein